jgi:hypothetical protein
MSVYLSYPGELSTEMDKELKKLKEIAQAPEPYQRINAQLSLDGHIFEVKDKGAPLFPYNPGLDDSSLDQGSFNESPAAVGPTARTRACRAPDGRTRGEGVQDAPPSNTASSNCNSGYFMPLRWGVDSLYAKRHR